MFDVRNQKNQTFSKKIVFWLQCQPRKEIEIKPRMLKQISFVAYFFFRCLVIYFFSYFKGRGGLPKQDQDGKEEEEEAYNLLPV